jgi:hypothetical protein
VAVAVQADQVDAVLIMPMMEKLVMVAQEPLTIF